MAISKRTRFEVFKRDGFICQYCGGTPPGVVLEVDHIFPVHPKNKSEDPGSDTVDNLLTACKDCNRGKANVSLGVCPDLMAHQLEILEEKRQQLQAYQRILSANERRIAKDIEKINSIYSSEYPGWSFSDNFKTVSLRTFLQRLPRQEIEEALILAIRKRLNKDRVIRYFCGICWKKIKGGKDANPT